MTSSNETDQQPAGIATPATPPARGTNRHDIQIEIARLMRRAAATLGDALNFYAPNGLDYAAAERNVTIHAGHAFMEEDFYVYGETSVLRTGKCPQKIDL